MGVLPRRLSLTLPSGPFGASGVSVLPVEPVTSSVTEPASPPNEATMLATALSSESAPSEPVTTCASDSASVPRLPWTRVEEPASNPAGAEPSSRLTTSWTG